MLRITFPESKQAWILTDLKHVLHWDIVWSHVRVEDNSTVTGFHLEHGWAKERYLYFAARYSRPFDDYKIISDGKPVVYGGDRFRSRSEIEGGASASRAARRRRARICDSWPNTTPRKTKSSR